VRTEGTSHVTESTAILYIHASNSGFFIESQKRLTVTKPVHPATSASSTTTVACTTPRTVFAPSAKFNATPNRMLT